MVLCGTFIQRNTMCPWEGGVSFLCTNLEWISQKYCYMEKAWCRTGHKACCHLYKKRIKKNPYICLYRPRLSEKSWQHRLSQERKTGYLGDSSGEETFHHKPFCSFWILYQQSFLPIQRTNNFFKNLNNFKIIIEWEISPQIGRWPCNVQWMTVNFKYSTSNLIKI